MPRKTRRVPRVCRPRRSRFNEAAARCRGKRRERRGAACGHGGASMRPRPDAAENPRPPRTRCSYSAIASMRPRPDAAENDPQDHRRGRWRVASMRPRPDAAENSCRSADRGRSGPASMRPRPDAAENPRGAGRIAARATPCFNEAAARCRGKPGRWPAYRFHALVASMRPRPDAAENGAAQAGRAVPVRASMRPRPDAAENAAEAGQRRRRRRASMRPRPDAAENPFDGRGPGRGPRPLQ